MGQKFEHGRVSAEIFGGSVVLTVKPMTNGANEFNVAQQLPAEPRILDEACAALISLATQNLEADVAHVKTQVRAALS